MRLSGHAKREGSLMRDATILEGFQRLTDATSDDLAKVSRANVMLRTRIDALEGVLLGSRFGILKMMVFQLLSPFLVARAVQARHTEEIKKFNEIRRKVAEARPKVVNAPTQGLITAL